MQASVSRFWVGTTDKEWFDFLSSQVPPVDEVNFWQPSGKPLFTSLPIFTPFLFKLKAPLNCIAGGGYFYRGSPLPVSIAWSAFEIRNGAANRAEFEQRLRRLSGAESVRDPTILCNVLVQPFFWPRELWIHDPEGWSRNIVRGKTYDTAEAEGASLWQRVEATLKGVSLAPKPVAVTAVGESAPRYGAPVSMRPRLGQGAFRVGVTDAYNRRCAITGENTLPVLEAAHIKPYADDGPHEVANGLLLRSDFHKLFDAGLVTVTPDLRVRVSRRIQDSYFNGKVYYRLQDQKLMVVPEKEEQRPDPDLLRWHNREKFAG